MFFSLLPLIPFPAVSGRQQSHYFGDPIYLQFENRCRRTFNKIIDNFCQEIERRLRDNDSLFRVLEFSEPTNAEFLDEAGVRLFCQKFARFDMDEELVVQQASIARTLLVAMQLERTVECIEYLLPMATTFNELIKYFRLVISFPVTSASCERSFSALKRIKSYLRSTMSDARCSSLSLLFIEKDLLEDLRQNPMRVVDKFAEKGDRRMTLKL